MKQETSMTKFVLNFTIIGGILIIGAIWIGCYLSQAPTISHDQPQSVTKTNPIPITPWNPSIHLDYTDDTTSTTIRLYAGEHGCVATTKLDKIAYQAEQDAIQREETLRDAVIDKVNKTKHEDLVPKECQIP